VLLQLLRRRIMLLLIVLLLLHLVPAAKKWHVHRVPGLIRQW
jgi:hypothetical protein